MRPRRQRWVNRSFVVLFVLTIVLGAALALSYARPSWLGVSRLSVGVVGGNIEIGWGSVPIERTPKMWRLRHPATQGAVIMGAPGGWKPLSTKMRLTSNGAVMDLRATWVPVWPWLLGLAVLTVTAWCFTRRVHGPGKCASCGYDLRGLTGGVCPECGAGLGSSAPAQTAAALSA